MRFYMKVLGIALLVTGAAALGIIDRQAAVGWTRYGFFRAKGEISQIGRPQPPGNVQHAKQCRENLHRLQAAKRKAAQDRGQTIGAVSWEEVVAAMHPESVRRRLSPEQFNALIPKCPGGGTYSVGTLEEVPRCSISGNRTIPVEDDHIILD